MKANFSWVTLIRGGVITYVLAVLAQLLSATTGLLLVNLLPKNEFALFAVFTALQQALSAQSDLGTLGAVGYFYRENLSWNAFKTITLPAIVRLRLHFFVCGAILLVALFLYSN